MQNRSTKMESTSDSVAQKGPHSIKRRPSGGIFASEVFGFPVSNNQFSVLQTVQPAESQSQLQREEGLVDPRSTRLSRLATQRAEDRGTLADRGFLATVPVYRDAQGILASGYCVDPVVSETCSQFFTHSLPTYPSDILYSQSVGPVQNLLGNGAIFDDALYNMDVNDVACMERKCNKRISVAGPERSAGRLGHTPIRHDLACGKHVEDSCAGQDWSAGRPGNRPFGASNTACPSPITACSGPYGTAYVQSHHTGPNTHEEKSASSSMQRQPQDQSISQPTASSSGRPAVEDRASPATVALHSHRPPYFAGGENEDVHVWTSIISH